MMSKTLEVDGLKEFERALEAAPEIAWSVMTAAMGNVLALLHDAVATYPPSTEANQPGRFSLKTQRPMGYYERGRGWWYPVMRKATLPEKLGKTRGAVRATRRTGVAGYKLAGGGKSELLGRKWTTAITEADDAIVGELGNNAGYANVVQGERQNRIHARRGWPTLGGTVDRLADDITNIFDSAVDDILRKTEEA
jgi:hypothetical protein